MPPFTFQGRYEDQTVRSWSWSWLARFVSSGPNFGAPLCLPSRSPPQISSLVLLPGLGLLMTSPPHNMIFLYSFSDQLTSVYAGSGCDMGQPGHRSITPLYQPSALCKLDENRLILVEKD